MEALRVDGVVHGSRSELSRLTEVTGGGPCKMRGSVGRRTSSGNKGRSTEIDRVLIRS